MADSAPADPIHPKNESYDGTALFLDVFRRADKNDDGKVSLTEFTSYFEDEHLSNVEMNQLFDQIDTDNSKNIDLEELVAFFKKDFEPYRALFAGLESTHQAIFQALHTTRQNYGDLSSFEKFKVRFYLKEFLTQLEVLHRPVEVALDKISDATERKNDHTRHVLPDLQPTRALNTSSVIPVGFSASAAAFSFSDSNDDEYHTAPSLHHEVNRLAALISKMERSSAFKLQVPDVDSALAHEESEAFVVVSNQFTIVNDAVDKFGAIARPYLKRTQIEEGSKYVYVKKADDSILFIYEVFSSEEAVKDHYATTHYKQFAKDLVDVLAKPAQVNSLPIPAEWFPTDE